MTERAVMRLSWDCRSGCSRSTATAAPNPTRPRCGGCSARASVGPDLERGPVRSDPGERQRDRHVEVGGKPDRGLARRSREHPERLGDVLDGDVVLDEIGRAARPRTGFRVTILTEWISPSAAAVTASSPRRAPGHHDWPPCCRQVDQAPMRERAGAEHDHGLSRPQERLGDFRQEPCRRASTTMSADGSRPASRRPAPGGKDVRGASPPCRARWRIRRQRAAGHAPSRVSAIFMPTAPSPVHRHPQRRLGAVKSRMESSPVPPRSSRQLPSWPALQPARLWTCASSNSQTRAGAWSAAEIADAEQGFETGRARR